MASGGRGLKPLFLYLIVAVLVTIALMGFYRSITFMSITAPGLQEGQETPAESLAARSLLGSVDILKPYTGSGPLLTMFTTFKNSKDRFRIHSNVLRNWAQYIPTIQPILFAFQTDEHLVQLAKSLGWLVLPTPKLSSTQVPYFKDMYFEAQHQVESIFYGYFNGDLLFDNGLVDTLLIIERFLDQLDQTLVIGMRTNFPMHGEELYKTNDITDIAHNKGKIFRTDAEDYFVIAHNSFPWEQIKDIVIGRPAYDNYVVGIAVENKISVVDATKTLLALHQSGIDGDFAGHQNSDNQFNLKVIGPFNYGKGHTTSSQYFTKYKNGQIELWKRSPAKVLIAKARPTLPPVLPTTTSTHVILNVTRASNDTSPVMLTSGNDTRISQAHFNNTDIFANTTFANSTESINKTTNAILSLFHTLKNASVSKEATDLTNQTQYFTITNSTGDS